MLNINAYCKKYWKMEEQYEEKKSSKIAHSDILTIVNIYKFSFFFFCFPFIKIIIGS